jgi:RNA polymerase sigma-70 factor (ECF subfamily)
VDAAQLFRENHQALCRYLVRYTDDAEIAADAAQEAFVRLLDRTPHMANPRAWLFTVATNLVHDMTRTRSRRRLILLRSAARTPHADPPPAPDETVQGEERRSRIREALASLSEKERMALLMREEGFTQREIAEAVGTTTGSVGTLIARAFGKLADRIDLDWEDL